MFTGLERFRRRAFEVWGASEGRAFPLRVVDLGGRAIRQSFRELFQLVYNPIDAAFAIFLMPVLNAILVRRRNEPFPNSVLHISYMVHIPWYTVQVLRRQGMRADYLAVGMQSPWWSKFDYHFDPEKPFRRFRQFLCFWRLESRYETIHSHFGLTLTTRPWELDLLHKLGRRVVVHYRGCEARDPVKNQALHPRVNICQNCDYHGTVCREGKARVDRIKPYGDVFLVTTPDMKDFEPSAIHFPFFTPEIEYEKYASHPRPLAGRPLRIVHATNHTGIEGTAHIENAIRKLQDRGFAIEFHFLKGVPPERVLEEYRDADVTIGKMKMGYYANAQIESMFLGVPAITWVRPEFMTPELEASGLIFSDLDHLEETIERLITHPEELERKRAVARESALRLHDNDALGRQLVTLYARPKPGSA